MKRNNLTTAVLAGITGIAGIASVSNAVNLNSDGVGQVLVYPYYTVNGNNNTLISVVNTTADVKAVKVRFLEGKNSRECLDFNLYLSPYDVWAAALVNHTSANLSATYDNQNSVKLVLDGVSPDTSCTAPAINGQQFLPWGFDPEGNGVTGDGYDRGGRDLQRCTEGHFEMIEMGTVVNTATNGNAANAATHLTTGSPASCSTIVGNWAAGGRWTQTPSAADPTAGPNDGLVAPDGTGGLFGSATILDGEIGTAISYNADAIQSYSTNIQHSDTGNQTPDLSTGNNSVSNIFNNGLVQSDDWNTSNIQAISALYMHNNIYGEYELRDQFNANTEMVVTFPTKFAYVDAFRGIFAAASIPFEPFEVAFTGTACEEYAINMWDREEQIPRDDVAPVIPSPLPPGIISTVPLFCYETNVLELHNNAVPTDGSVSEILQSSLVTHWATTATSAPSYFGNGWVALNFTQLTDDNAAGATYTGLPVTGFTVQRYVNNTSASKNYASIFGHRYSKSISN